MSSFLEVKSVNVTLADDKIEAVSKALAPVLEKHFPKLGAAGMPVEITAAFTAGPILWAATRGVIDELEAKRAAKAKPAPVAYVVPPSGPVVTHADVADMVAADQMRGPNG